MNHHNINLRLTSRRWQYYSICLPILIMAVVQPESTFVEATTVRWSDNHNVSPKHQAAHDAPRSQRYWDEHGIERPDYAKSDAEIASERQLGQVEKHWFRRAWSLLLVLVIGMSTIMYVSMTGNWDKIRDSQLGFFIEQGKNQLMELGGLRGRRLGPGAEKTQFSLRGVSEKETQRLVRLARFEHPKELPKNLSKTD